MRFDTQLAALAGPRWGVFTLAELVDLGLSCRAVQHRAAIGRLHRLYRAVYSLAPPPLLPVKGCYRAAALACGDGAALSAREAADLLGLRRSNRRRIDVIVPGRTTRRHDGIELHRSVNLAEHDLTVVEGIRVTTVARTALDLSALVPRRQVERALDQAEVLEVFDLVALHDQLARNPRHPGAPILQAVLATHEAGQTVTWSELEELCLAVTRDAGVEAPEVNAFVDPGDGEPPIRVDFVWRAQRVVVEADSRRHHRTNAAFENDRRRDQRLHIAGWRPLRVTWRQLTRERQRIEAMLTALLTRG